jgi:hypothetical protein
MADLVPLAVLPTLQAQLPAAAQAAAQPNQNSTQRLLAFVAVLVLPFLNALLSKWGMAVSETQLVTAMGIGAGYIAQSVANAIHARSLAAAQASAPTPAAAVADLNKGVSP